VLLALLRRGRPSVRVTAAAFAAFLFVTLAPLPAVQPAPVAAATYLNVPFFSQRDSAWRNTRLGRCLKETIGSAGCAITSEAMVYRFYGAKVSTSLGKGMNPRLLNKWLKGHNGYASGCLVKWGKTPKGVKYTGSDTSRTHVRNELKAGRPVIAGVTGPGIPYHHFVVIVGRNSSGFLINDPLDLTKKVVNLSAKKYKAYRFWYFKPTT
jgi:hypothetical protein